MKLPFFYLIMIPAPDFPPGPCLKEIRPGAHRANGPCQTLPQPFAQPSESAFLQASSRIPGQRAVLGKSSEMANLWLFKTTKHGLPTKPEPVGPIPGELMFQNRVLKETVQARGFFELGCPQG